MHKLIAELYPICRSITGHGVRKTLQILQRYIPLEISEVPTGTQVFDWTVPKEWNIRDAYIKDSDGNRIVDFNKSNLHVLNYSVPMQNRMSLEALKPHFFTIPEQPGLIPYRTSYYKEDWGFCLSHDQFLAMKDDEYDVLIDSSLNDGFLTYGEYFLPGETAEEFLFSCHVCHPSLCNDNLSGVALVTFLADTLKNVKRRYSYRFLFIPGTIGAITWLARNEALASNIRHGLVVACVGDGGKFTYKKSRRGDAEIDRAVAHVLKHSGAEYELRDFSPYGYDERQFCSPGFNLPVGSLTRTPHGEYPEYHTSDDNLELVQPDALAESLTVYRLIVDMIERNQVFVNLNPKCEPQLGKRGLYGQPEYNMAMLWLLNLSDGDHDILAIAEHSGIDFKTLSAAADRLCENNLLRAKISFADKTN